MAGAMTAGLGYVGVKTGLFKTMQGQGAMTIEQIAQVADLKEYRQQ